MLVCRMLVAAAVLSVLPQLSATAAILIEARKQGQPFRIVLDNGQQRALVSMAQGESLIDLAAGEIYVRGPGGVASQIAIEQEPVPVSSLYRVEPWGPGPVIAGQSTVYHVITYGGEICAEMLVSGWMKPFVAPLVQALDRLEDLSGMPRGHGCDRIPFATYAAQGWPIMAGKIDHLTFETESVRFDYQPSARELALPAHYESRRPDQIVLQAFAPKP
jgi:hypothetical protein